MIEENIIVELSSEKHAADVAAISMFLPSSRFLLALNHYHYKHL